MPLVGAALVPHSPLLIPSIAKDHAALADQTRAVVLEIGQLVYAAHPTEVVVLTPHGATVDGRVVVLTGETLTGDLRDFGDLEPFSVSGALPFAQHIATELLHHGVNTMLKSDAVLDYGTIVPLRLFSWPKPVNVVPISVAHLSPDVLINLGRGLAEVAQKETRRVLLIASADFSRRKAATERLDRPTAIERQVARAVRARRTADAPAVTRQSCCGLAPTLVLLSAVEGRAGQSNHITSEAPYGVGYVTAWLNI